MASLERHLAALVVALGIGSVACTDDAPPDPLQEKVKAVPEKEVWTFPQLSAPVYVLRTEGNEPHVYAENQHDLGFVLGFVTARDRYFMMDLERRLAQGRISELLGDAALEIDLESRGTGMTYVTQQIEAAFEGELAAYVDAFAAGVNAYIEEAIKETVPEPSEVRIASLLLGITDRRVLLQPFSRRDLAACFATVLYNSSYETDDIGRAAAVEALPTLFEGAAYQDLRRQGAIEDIYEQIVPIHPIASAPGFISEATSARDRFPGARLSLGAREALARLNIRMEQRRARLGRDPDVGWGSNAWAVAAGGTSDGAALMAGDGHLSLAVPPLLFRMGLDTSVFGGGPIHENGLTIPGLPMVVLGTNGRVAWSQTQIAGDVTDWYLEQVQLDENGEPARARFDGEWRHLVEHEEKYVIAEVEALDSEGRTETWKRWETFDGRWIADIEGREPMDGETPGPGEALLSMQGTYVIPEDVDGDGMVWAYSFDYTAFDAAHVPKAFEAFRVARNVSEFFEAAKNLVANSLNYAVADADGSIMYGSFQPFPCRTHLDRESDGSWAAGANPQLLIDGTRYGGFTLPFVNGRLDETSVAPDTCAIPYLETPHIINPAQQYVVTANNDPGGMSFDGSVTNDGRYFGGPWDVAFRANTIATALETAIADGDADIDKMAEIQGNIDSPIGALLLDSMLASLDYAEGLGATPTDPADQRIAALFASETDAIAEVRTRMAGWRDRGFKARSGVETFYNEPDGEEIEDSIATMIFNAWMSRYVNSVLDDEGIPGGAYRNSGLHARLRALMRFLEGRGAGNPLGLASFNTETNESVFFDVLGTPEVETSHELVVKALVDALAFLRSAPAEDAEPATGGFATDDMTQWLWGLRHYVKFTSLLGDFIEGPEYEPITNTFAITTDKLPLVQGGVSIGDPRKPLLWFPRDGDQFAVDAANPGTSGTNYGYGSGPVMRMVVSLKGDEVHGQNIIPGGQSALTDSEFFLDQVKLWLANETTPMRFTVDQVVEYESVSRETYQPAQ